MGKTNPSTEIPHEDVKTVVGPDLYGYIEKTKLESFLKDLFGKDITVYLGNDRFWFYAERKVEKSEFKSIRSGKRVKYEK